MDIYVELQEIKQGMQKIIDLLPKQSKELKEKLYDNSDVMRLLHVSRRTLSNYRSTGKIEYSQVGSKIFYTQQGLDQFLAKYRIKSFLK